jgi:hypothetical protein
MAEVPAAMESKPASMPVYSGAPEAERDYSHAAPDEDDLMGAMYELAHQENTAPAQSNAVYCPQCQTQMVRGAILCTNCGYNVDTGKSLKTSTDSPVKKVVAKASKKGGKKQVDYMAPDGSIVLGILFSAAFALVASLLWIVIAYATGVTIGYIAMLIGFAAGIGMQLGHRGYSTVGGYIAGALTLVAILLAKLAVLQVTLSRMGFHKSIFALNAAVEAKNHAAASTLNFTLAYYFFSPMGIIIMLVGIFAAYRTASGSVRN